jgi:hypothetical protein
MFRIDELPKGFDALQKATPMAENKPTGWKCLMCQRMNAPSVKVCPCPLPNLQGSK